MKKENNAFGLAKNKYKKTEVIAILNEKTQAFDTELADFRAQLSELKAENARLTERINEYDAKNAIIESAIKDAEEKAAETEEKTKLRYSLVAEKLKSFSERWDDYFRYLKNKYPLYPLVKTSTELREKIAELLAERGNADAVDALDEKLKAATAGENVKKEPFDPKSKIRDYVAATSDNGFNLEEVLNPGELHLEDLCKELGLLE